MGDEKTIVCIPTTEQEEKILIEAVYKGVLKTLNELGFSIPGKQLFRIVNFVVKETLEQIVASDENRDL